MAEFFTPTYLLNYTRTYFSPYFICNSFVIYFTKVNMQSCPNHIASTLIYFQAHGHFLFLCLCEVGTKSPKTKNLS